MLPFLLTQCQQPASMQNEFFTFFSEAMLLTDTVSSFEESIMISAHSVVTASSMHRIFRYLAANDY